MDNRPSSSNNRGACCIRHPSGEHDSNCSAPYSNPTFVSGAAFQSTASTSRWQPVASLGHFDQVMESPIGANVFDAVDNYGRRSAIDVDEERMVNHGPGGFPDPVWADAFSLAPLHGNGTLLPSNEHIRQQRHSDQAPPRMDPVFEEAALNWEEFDFDIGLFEQNRRDLPPPSTDPVIERPLISNEYDMAGMYHYVEPAQLGPHRSTQSNTLWKVDHHHGPSYTNTQSHVHTVHDPNIPGGTLPHGHPPRPNAASAAAVVSPPAPRAPPADPNSGPPADPTSGPSAPSAPPADPTSGPPNPWSQEPLSEREEYSRRYETQPIPIPTAYPSTIPPQIMSFVREINSCPPLSQVLWLPAREWLKSRKHPSIYTRYAILKRYMEAKKGQTASLNPILQWVGDTRLMSHRLWAYMLFRGRVCLPGEGDYEAKYEYVFGAAFGLAPGWADA